MAWSLFLCLCLRWLIDRVANFCLVTGSQWPLLPNFCAFEWVSDCCLMPINFIVLAHYSPCVDMSLHSDTLFWFRANQSLLFLLNAACNKYQLHSLCFYRPVLESTIYCTRGEHANHYATDAVFAHSKLMTSYENS